MRDNKSYNEAARAGFFGLAKKTTAIPEQDRRLLSEAEIVANSFGIAFSDNLKVEKYQGRELNKVDEYTALRSGPGSN